MTKILSIETAASVCSAAVHENGRLLAVQELFIDKSHSGQLTLAIDNLVKNAGLELKDLSAVAVSEGPGSYTGLRIGTSTGKGLCYALDIPLLAVNTLEAMAAQAKKFNLHDALLCPMLDARRMEVYCMLADASGKTIRETEAKVLDEDSFSVELAEGPVIFFGSGAEKTKQLFGNNKNALYWDDVQPSAVGVGILAYEKFKNEQFEDVAYFEPFYLKEFRLTTPKKKLL